MYDFYSFTYLDRTGNQATIQLKVPNPLYHPSFPKENSSKDLLEESEATKMTSIQELEQGTYDYLKISFLIITT